MQLARANEERPGRGAKSSLTRCMQQSHKQIRQCGSDWYRQNPGPDHSFDNRPFDGVETPRCADSHNGRGDVVSRADWNSQFRRCQYHSCGTGLSSKPIDWMQLYHLVPERLDDAPATDCRP